jgi:hypothetical protein
MESEVVSQAVAVIVTGEWKSGNSTMHVSLNFTAASLDEALRMVQRATDGAPSFKNPLEEGQS